MLRKILNVFLVACLIPVQFSGTARAASGAFEEVQLLKGDFFTIPTKGLQKVSLTDPNVADINDAKPDQIVLLGQAPGQTILFIWDDSGKRTVIVRVLTEDLTVLKARIKGLLANASIDGVVVEQNDMEGKILLTGAVPAENKDRLNGLLEPFNASVMNMVKFEENQDLIQIDMQVTELSTTLSKELGVDWSGSGASGVIGFSENHPGQPSTTGQKLDLFKIGSFDRTGFLNAKINALITDNKGHILSKPRLVVKNGKEATLQVGGEVPIKSVSTNTASSGVVTQNTTFKSYGISMAITPTIKDGKVDMTLTVELSDIDTSVANLATGDVAFTTRSAQTQLFLDDRQTIVLAGLIKKRNDKNTKRVPVLGSIPVLGYLFRNDSSPTNNGETEVVISITPTIIKSQVKKAAVPEIKPEPVLPVAVKAAPASVPLGEASSRNREPLPVITKNSANVPVTIAPELKPYAELVQQKISSAIAYPYEAQENGWQGTVKLGLVIRRDGSLRDVFIKDGSGYDVFDQDAVNTSQILAPYPPFSAGMTQQEITITLPIVYNLDAFLKNVAKRKQL